MNKKNKIKFKRKYIYILASIPLFLLLFKNLFFNNFNSNIFLLNNPSDFQVQINSKAVVIKNEFLYYIGENTFELEEKKIGTNVKIGDIDKSKDSSEFVGILDRHISEMEEDLKKYDGKKIPKFNFEDFSNLIRSRSFSKAIEFTNSNKTSLFKKHTLEERLFRYTILRDTLKSGSIVTKNSGLLSTKIDGLENIYNSDIIDLIDEKDFNFSANSSNPEKLGVKIVNNLNYHLGMLVDKDIFKDKKTIDVLLGENIVTGTIKSIKSGEKKDLIIAEFSSLFEYIKDKRLLEVKIVKNYKNSYEIPSSSVVDEGEDSFIYILDSLNNVEKIKVEKLYEDASKNIVYINSKNLYLNPFANVVKDSSKLKKVDIGEK